MGTTAILSALVGVLVFLAGLAMGSRLKGNASKAQMEEAVANERKLGATREGALKEQLDGSKAEIAELKPKAEELVAAKQKLEGEEKKYAQMKADLDTAFKSAAADALLANTKSFLTLAQQVLGGQNQEAQNTLEQKEQAIKALLDPLKETLGKLDLHTREMEKTREGAYVGVQSLIAEIKESIPKSVDALRNETAQLIAAFRAPKTRGNWGELQLKRCVEYAGMVQYCSFSQQVTARDDEDKLLRPDMIIQLPNGREIVVDAKTPLDAFLDASATADAASQALRFTAHAQRVRTHLKELSGKAYWRQFEKAPDFVVCFLPSEALFSAALEADPSLIEFSAQSHVVMATPTTLIALLRAVEFGWQQSEITQNAKAIHEMGRKIYDKLVVAQAHVIRLGNALSSSVDHYNRFLGSIEGKGGVFSYGRQLGDLAHSDGELAEIRKLPTDVREMDSQEWSQPLLSIAAGGDEDPSDPAR
ncbi:MAG TPA: DNA recombination protein RmuC [Terracidiphilus sp.]|nr:DNA recombination protein RmuC [Terracidiphilus sp.]